MDYYLNRKTRWGNMELAKLRARTKEDAIKETIVMSICDYWGWEIADDIDYENFDTWIINYLKTSKRYWNLSAIFENINALSNLDYKTTSERVRACLKLFDEYWLQRAQLLEVVEESKIGNEAISKAKRIVGDVIEREYMKDVEAKEMAEYERLKKKYEITR